MIKKYSRINKTRNKTRDLLLKIGTAAVIAAAPAMITGCNPVDTYRTLAIRQAEPDLYNVYKNIDMNNLTPAEQAYLNEVHKEYGNKPIGPKRLSNTMDKKTLSTLLSLTGKKEFGDKECIFMYRISDELIGTMIQPAMPN